MSLELLNARKQEVIAKVNACVEKGYWLFCMVLPEPVICFDLKGRCAGMAEYRRGQVILRFNTDMMLRDSWHHIINDTVPHEVAHSFCHVNPRLGSRHNAGWAKVCKLLGGSGDRCHSEAVVYGKGRTFEYTTTTGQTVRASEAIHKRIQQGTEYTYRNKGKVNRFCSYVIVGHQGVTLKAPVAAVPNTVPNKKLALIETKTGVTFVRTVQVTRCMAVEGESKADVARRIMVQGHAAGHSYEVILQTIMTANGHDRRLAASYYKNNAPKVGVPLP